MLGPSLRMKKNESTPWGYHCNVILLQIESAIRLFFNK